MRSLDVMLLAFGWVCVFEGFAPMASPESWKKTVQKLSQSPVPAIRMLGTILVVVGLTIIWAVA